MGIKFFMNFVVEKYFYVTNLLLFSSKLQKVI